MPDPYTHGRYSFQISQKPPFWPAWQLSGSNSGFARHSTGIRTSTLEKLDFAVDWQRCRYLGPETVPSS